MLSRQIIDQFPPCDFDRLARKEHEGRRRLRLNRAGASQGRQELSRGGGCIARNPPCCHALGSVVYRRRRGPSGRSAT